MLAVVISASSGSWVDLLFVACVFALLAGVPLVTDSRAAYRAVFVGAVLAVLAAGVGIVAAFPTAYCDWFFKALGYCK